MAGARVTLGSDVAGSDSFYFGDCLRSATLLQEAVGVDEPISIAIDNTAPNGRLLLVVEVAWRNEVFAVVEYTLDQKSEGWILWGGTRARCTLVDGGLAAGELAKSLITLLEQHAKSIMGSRKASAARRSAARQLLSRLTRTA